MLKALFPLKALLLIAFFLLSLTGYSQTVVTPQGSGTEADPYLIANWQELYWVSQTDTVWDKHFKQTAHIDFAEAVPTVETWYDGKGWSPIGNNSTNFSGNYDGNRFTIANLYINRPSYNYQGLFGYEHSDAVIKNLGVVNATVSGDEFVGTLCGYVEGTVEQCFVTGQVEGKDDIGGFVGYNSGEISNCFANVYISGAKTGKYSNYFGGFSGGDYGSDFLNCYSKAINSGIYASGFATGGSATNSFWDSERFGTTNSNAGTAKNTAEMQSQATYTGWDFTTVWSINPNINGGYPVLKQFEALECFLKPECFISGTITEGNSLKIAGNLLIGNNPVSTYSLLIGTEKSNGVVSGDNLKTIEYGSVLNSKTFEHTISNLEFDTEYYVQIFAQNNDGVGYSPAYKARTAPLHITPPEGSGDSEADPYLIESLAHLYWIANQVNNNRQTFEGKYFKQVKDIDATVVRNYNNGNGWIPIGTQNIPFQGTYDGSFFEISHLYMSGVSNAGFFRSIGNNAVIKTMALKDMYISGINVAPLAYINYGHVSQCSTSIDFSMDYYCGGFSGFIYSNEGMIEQSYSLIKSWEADSFVKDWKIEELEGIECDISYSGDAFVSNNYNGTIANCYFEDDWYRYFDKYGYDVYGHMTIDYSYYIHQCSNCYYYDYDYRQGLFRLTDEDDNYIYDISEENQRKLETYINAGFDFLGETANGTEDIWAISPSINNGLPFLTWQVPQITYLGGSVYYDRDKDGTQSAGDVNLGGIKVELQPEGTITGTLSDGSFHFYSEPGDYTVKVLTKEPYSQGQSPLETPVTLELLKDSTLNATGLYGTDVYDFTLSSATVWSRCGRTVPAWLVVQNTGNMPSDLELRLVPDSNVTFKGAEPAESSVAANGEIVFDLANVQPSEKRVIEMQFQMPVATMDSIEFASTLYRNGQIIEQDTLRNLIRCSYDPNDIQVMPQGHSNHGYVPMGQELTYMIRFQNTGNDTAFMVDVLDTLATALDPLSFEMLASSHEVRYFVERNGALRFLFEDINLEDSTSNELASHGFVLFKVKPFGSVAAGTQALSTAHIYFDSNPAVVTNTVQTTFTDQFTPMQQDIELKKGWNLVSLYVEPSETELNWALNSCIEDIICIKTDTEFYTSGQPEYFNSLSAIHGGQAYLINAKQTTTLSVNGLLILAPFEHNLKKGWNMIGYPLRSESDVTPKLEATSAESAKDFEGVWLPQTQTNSLLQFKPGKGYFIYSNQNESLPWKQ